MLRCARRLLYAGSCEALLSHGPGPKRERHEIQVHGVVQGVGFRPFAYRLAVEEGLGGFIGNNTEGVTLEVEGPPERLAAFRARLISEAPPLAHIDAVAVRSCPPKQEETFRIVRSEVYGLVSTGIPADAATCPDCLRELFDPADRRYRYPFLNCTNCGPRYTITRRIPYDRPQTSMAGFSMCAACQAEYDDPANRRFHAQPNACPACGPCVWLVEADVAGEVSGRDFRRAENAPRNQCASAPGGDSAIRLAIDRLLAGQIIAIKGIGGFHLAADATSETAVKRLRQRKRRFGKPLAVMVRDLASARAICVLTPLEEAQLTTPARPIVLARVRPANGVVSAVAPGIPWLGIFLPYAPLQHLLFADPRIHALVMTSANLSEEPIAIDNREAGMRLGQIADAFLLHDREILQRCDDSVVAVVDGAPQFHRRARGFVPLGVPLPFEAQPLLAVGGHLKNVFTLARGHVAYQSQHLGDLETLTGLDFFRESLDHLMRTFAIEPQAVAHDLHPGYLSTSWAKKWAGERNQPLIGVQHHHAHIAGCMAEHGLAGPVIGLALDGTGYGTDGRIWGGEVLIVRLDGPDPAQFHRFAHLEYVPMPGGEAAIREPWRMALAGLLAAGFDAESQQVRALLGAKETELRVLRRMIERGVNVPLTSSLGRLFDAVAALTLGRREVDYEAQAAIEFEGICVAEPVHLDRIDYIPKLFEGQPLTLKTGDIFRAVAEDLSRGVSKARVAANFHSGVMEGFVSAAMRARDETGIDQVTMSGGCMHNRRLVALLHSRLREQKFRVYSHRQVSPGDGGLSYGQAVVAAAILRRG